LNQAFFMLDYARLTRILLDAGMRHRQFDFLERGLSLWSVMAGLDPAIHSLRKTLLKVDGYAGQARV
jgi:hypothetical protein